MSTEQFPCLTTIPVGQYPCKKWHQLTKRGGWLSVSRENGETSILWTSSKETHNPLSGPATAIDIDQHGNITALYESVLSLHLKWRLGFDCEPYLQRALAQAGWMASVLCKS
jgi:hypothetical protein